MSTTAPRGRTKSRLHGGDLDRIVGYLATRARLALERTYDSSAGRDTGLHRVEFTILALVKANPGCTAATLSRELGVSTPNMTLWLDRLSGKGLLARRPSATDRRSNHLRLTREGAESAGQAVAAIQAAEREALAGLSEGETNTPYGVTTEGCGVVAGRGLNRLKHRRLPWPASASR